MTSCYKIRAKIQDMIPTHYTEMSSSTIDLMITSNKNNVLLSGVGEPIFDQNTRTIALSIVY